jgi:hypothetical protein
MNVLSGFLFAHRKDGIRKPVLDDNCPERRLAMKNGIVAIFKH